MPINRTNKHLLFSIFIFLFLFLSASFVLALEVPLPGLGDDPTLPEYIIYFFKFGISVAGILALISFTIGAIGLINPNIEAHNDAKDRMKGAVLGLVLTLASFIIINTINPALTTPTFTPLPEVTIPTPPPQPGVYYYLNSDCSDENNSSGDNPSGGNNSGGDNPSAVIASPHTSSQDEIESPFKGNIKGVKIINDAENKLYYGVIFHKITGLENGGACSLPITDEGCQPVNIRASAADIFTLNENPGASGDGVTFYSEPYGWNTGARAGFFSVPDDVIILPYFPGNSYRMCFDYTNIDRPDSYKYMCTNSNCGYENRNINCSNTACETFQDCPGSIKIRGDYLVGLYSKDLLLQDYCQTFTQDVPNLNAQPMIASGAVILDKVYIIPTK